MWTPSANGPRYATVCNIECFIESYRIFLENVNMFNCITFCVCIEVFFSVTGLKGKVKEIIVY